MEKNSKNQENLVLQEGLPLSEEQTEEIIEEIQELLDSDEQPAALEIFSQLRPGDQSEVIEELSLESQQEILISIPPDEAAEIIEHLQPEEVVKVTEGVDTAVLSDILDAADSDVQADIIRHLPDEKAEDVLEEMEEAALVTQLLQYSDDSAGGRMVLEYVVVRQNATTTDALNALRQNEPEVEDIHSIFVVDSQGKLTGEISVSRLALSRPNTRIKRIMDTEITYVTSDTPQEECVRVMERYSLNHLPVVDEEQRLVGVINSEDILKVIEEEATEDMYRLAGIPGERIFGPLLLSIRNRLPWLSLNLVTTFLAALVISIFESTIARVVTLAVFLPVVAGQGGIGGTQTLTLVVRGIALGEISKRGGLRLLGREISLGILHGVILGIIVGLVAYIWKGNYMLGAILALAMIGNMFIAGLTGAGIPILLTRLRIDPALASAVLVTTCTDVIGFLLFLGLAAMLVSHLL
ncbi:MAG: magnesium transporter [Dehalococcoidales bacterium]|nr:MAG: magnesium transporter [Dehalococcoidales bacterium]